MDIQEIEQLIRQPQESAKVEFKIQLYKLYEPRPKIKSEEKQWADEKEKQWAELVKDILSLTNGNIGTANQTAYLIIGADDKVKPDGTPNIRDIRQVGIKIPNRKEIYDKVNSYCSPRLPDIECDTFLFEGKQLLVISIPPSPYLHKLSKTLKTPTGKDKEKHFSTHTVLIRRGDGEEIYEASQEEQAAITQEKSEISRSATSAFIYGGTF